LPSMLRAGPSRISDPMGPVLCKNLDSYFGEFTFYEVG
jgi:hypothetical protein